MITENIETLNSIPSEEVYEKLLSEAEWEVEFYQKQVNEANQKLHLRKLALQKLIERNEA